MAQRRIVLGRVNGLFGIKGWVKVYSYTRPPQNLLDYDRWFVGRQDAWRPFRVLSTRIQGKSLMALLGNEQGEPLADRDAAAALLELDIAVDRDELPALAPGEHYWFDLIGCDVINREGVSLGRVASMMETGANDVLVLAGERQRLIPFVMDEVVDTVDCEAGRIVVDWDPDF